MKPPLPLSCAALMQAPSAAAAGLEDLTDTSAKSTPQKEQTAAPAAAAAGDQAGPAAKRQRKSASPASSQGAPQEHGGAMEPPLALLALQGRA